MGWCFAQKEFDNYYKQSIKSNYEDEKTNILSQKKLVPSVYADLDSSFTDSDMENEMIINKNKEVTQTKNCRRKNSNKETADDDQVLDEDERNMLKTTQGVIIQNVRICDGHCGIMI